MSNPVRIQLTEHDVVNSCRVQDAGDRAVWSTVTQVVESNVELMARALEDRRVPPSHTLPVEQAPSSSSTDSDSLIVLSYSGCSAHFVVNSSRLKR